MLRWLTALLGGRTAPVHSEVPEDGRRGPVAGSAAVAEALPADDGLDSLDVEAREFYEALVTPGEPADLQSFGTADRMFLSGILKRLRENRLEIPVLPRAALEISRLLSDPKSDAGDFARVLKADPALSVDVLRIANSAYYGFGRTVNSVRDAVVRIGMNQLRGLIILSHLQGKVLRGGLCQRETEWLSELSVALGYLGHALARDLGLDADESFTRGVLCHAEHFVIMGTVPEVSKDHKRRIQPSRAALLESFVRFGSRVRRVAAHSWGLESLLLADGEGGADAARTGETVGRLRQALVAHWVGQDPRGFLPEVPAPRLQAAVERARVSGEGGAAG